MFRRSKIITKGLVADLPNSIELNIEHLNIGMFTYIKDITIEGCELVAPGNSVVVGVKTARTVVEEEETEGTEGAEGAEGDAPAEGAEAPAAE